MLGYVLGSVVVLLVCLDLFLSHYRSRVLLEKVTAEGELLKENLNHLAGAIISMSELLDDADEVIENISKVPTVGEMIQQAIVGFVTQKVQQVIPEPMVAPMQEVISEKFASEHYGETKTYEEKEISNEIQESI